MKNQLFVLLSLLMISPVALAEDPPAGEVSIESFSHRGNGCPDGSVATNISDDAKAITVLFDEYFVETNGRGASRKACNMDLKMKVPRGWTFGLFCLDIRGYASLDEGVVGRQKVKYKFGRTGMDIGNLRLDGPFDDDYEHLQAFPLNSIVWAPCGGGNGRGNHRNLNLDTSVHIASRGSGGSGLMTVDSVDGELKHHYGIAWKRCPGGDDEDGDDDENGPSNQVFETSKSMTLLNGQTCTNVWRSTDRQRLEVVQDECSSLIDNLPGRMSRLARLRLQMLDRQARMEFRQWLRR